MSLLKRIVALAGVISILSVFAASCHKKDETAMKIDGIKITGSLYLAFMVEADSEAQNTLATTDASGNSTVPENYKNDSINGKSYKAWMDEKVMYLCRGYALSEKLFKEYDLEFNENEEYTIDYYSQYYWTNGYQSLYEANGVSYDTYRLIMANTQKKNKIFNHYYDKGGTKEVPEKDKKEALEKLYVLANTLEISYTTGEDGSETTMTDDEKAAAKTDLEKYLTRLNKESFDKVKTDFDAVYNPTEEEEEDTSASDAASSDAASSDAASSKDASSDTSSEEEEENSTAMDATATAYGSADSQSASQSATYEKIFEMKAGEKKIIELDGSVMLAIRKNILDDPYYLKYYNIEVLSFLKNDEFEKEFDEQAADMKVDKNSYVMGLYNPSKLEAPQS